MIKTKNGNTKNNGSRSIVLADLDVIVSSLTKDFGIEKKDVLEAVDIGCMTDKEFDERYCQAIEHCRNKVKEMTGVDVDDETIQMVLRDMAKRR